MNSKALAIFLLLYQINAHSSDHPTTHRNRSSWLSSRYYQQILGCYSASESSLSSDDDESSSDILPHDQTNSSFYTNFITHSRYNMPAQQVYALFLFMKQNNINCITNPNNNTTTNSQSSETKKSKTTFLDEDDASIPDWFDETKNSMPKKASSFDLYDDCADNSKRAAKPIPQTKENAKAGWLSFLTRQ